MGKLENESAWFAGYESDGGGGVGDGGGGAGVASESAALFEANEHLTRDLARVRAKFAMDAPPGQLPATTLTRAWMSELALEEYEAEFVDTVADCMGAGLSLQDALTCWDSGDLAADATDESDGAALDDDGGAAPIAPIAPRRPTGGHRVFVR